MSNQPIKELVLPAPHIEARLVSANETYMLAGRGTFKTSRGISIYCIDCIYDMPRSTGVGVGLSFEHLGDNTLPPLLQAWDEFGFSHGDHFVVGKRPPKEWPRPYLGMINEKWDHTISFHNGTVIMLVSLAKKASANGISAQWGFFDEVKFMKQAELTDEIFPIFRGNEKHFGQCSKYLSKFFATDKKADPVMIQWLLDKAKLNDPHKNKIVIALALQLNQLKQQYNTVSKSARDKLKPQIHATEVRLAKLRSQMVHYVEVNAYDVLYAHGEKWLKDKKRNSTKHDFEVVYENKNPDRPGDSFYPAFDQALHTYENEYDIDPGKPLIITPDYQHSVSPINVAQIGKLPGHEKPSLNYVDEVYTLANPQEEAKANGNGKQGGLTESVQLFCDRYKGHIRKTVYYIFDHTAVGKRVDAASYKDTVINTLKKNGWHVIEVYTGQAPEHFIKYTDAQDFMQGKRTDLAIRINRTRCERLIISVTGAPAYIKNGRTAKDKNSELEPTLDQSKTTHFSDTFDMTNHAVLKLQLIKPTSEPRKAGTR